ncbi:MAG TPA: inorganic diphosphatase [Tepidisphaeraceae bacterium]|nr:inorganic diphosphatase [Tepidisphaeraceae bacterium]
MPDLSQVQPFDDDQDDAGAAAAGLVNAIIETPKGSRNKFTYQPVCGLFKLDGVLPAGAVYPFDYGMIPGTLGDDGDPLDVLVLMDAPAFTGCWVPARLIGAIVAEQTERDGRTERNDRLVAVAAKSRDLEDVRELSDLSKSLLRELEHFFVSFNQVKGKTFRVRGRRGAAAARRLVRAGARRRAKH